MEQNLNDTGKQHREPDPQFLFNKEKTGILRQVRRKIRGWEKQILRRTEQLQTCEGWHRDYHNALLLQSNLYRIKKGESSVTVSDWEQEGQECTIELDTTKEPAKQVQSLFKKARKLKAGIEPNKKRVKEAEEQLERWKKLQPVIEAIEDQEALEAFKKEHQIGVQASVRASPKEIKPYLEFNSEKGIPIWVGKNARSNEIMTFRYAKGSDWWLHAEDYPGSHVIIRLDKNQEPDQGTIEDAVMLAISYSKAKGEASVCVTQKKFVEKLGKRAHKTGAVHISRHKTLRRVLDPERICRLKQRSL